MESLKLLSYYRHDIAAFAKLRNSLRLMHMSMSLFCGIHNTQFVFNGIPLKNPILLLYWLYTISTILIHSNMLHLHHVRIWYAINFMISQSNKIYCAIFVRHVRLTFLCEEINWMCTHTRIEMFGWLDINFSFHGSGYASLNSLKMVYIKSADV